MRKTILKVLILAFSFNFLLNDTFKISSGVIENNRIDKETINSIGKRKIFDLEMNLDNLQKILKLLKQYDYKNAPKKKFLMAKLFIPTKD